MNWIKGGPYYELSFLLRNSGDKEKLIIGILEKLQHISSIEIVETPDFIKEKIDFYKLGEASGGLIWRSLGLKAKAQISGSRKFRLVIVELSSELVKLNFWFFGGLKDEKAWNQKGIKPSDKKEFRNFFTNVRDKLKPILGTMAYEEDCAELFDHEKPWPNEAYSLKQLSISKIEQRVNRTMNEFEYCWINGDAFEKNENIEFEIKIDYPPS